MTETAAPPFKSLLPLVNPLQGTRSEQDFSRGNTLALVARPFGMTHWSPQSRASERWFFHPDDEKLMGIRATHQPSPWMGDYGHFTVMAAVVEDGVAIDPATYAAPYRPEDLIVRPDYLSVRLQDGMQIEMTPTERCAVFRFTPPAGNKVRIWINAHTEAAFDAAHSEFRGRSNVNHGGIAGDFGCRFVAYLEDQKGYPLKIPQIPSASGIAVVEVTPGITCPTSSVILVVGTSFISEAQAETNIVREYPEFHRETEDLELLRRKYPHLPKAILTNGMEPNDFESIRRQTVQIWEKTLGIVQLDGGTDAQQRTFYTCLYRTQLFPRELHEFDASGEPIHYSPYDGKVHPGVLYGDSGFWDTYRTQFPLLSLLNPTRYGEIVQGLVNAFHEGGWFPQWPSPGMRAVMIGTHIDAVIADAVVKNIPGFDREAAYAGLLKDADVLGDPHDRFGRVGLTDYLTLGYVPSDRANKATARSLDYYFDDFCISQVAEALGKTDDARRLRERAGGYPAVYDARVGFMWGRHADGGWQPDFDEWAWGGPYVEGGAWQSTWAVPHDPAGLIALMGGRKAFVAKLDRMLLQSPRFSPGTYGGVIHEMAEMAAVDFGQYDQGNQPVHLALALFSAAGCPAKTQYWTRRVLSHLFSAEQFAGDEDNGEMSAWYILNALGLFPLCPGHPSYVLGAPLFPHAAIALADGKTLQIDAPDTSDTNVYATALTINGEPCSALRINHDTLVAGARLAFTLSDRPVDLPIADADLPFALSPYPALTPDADLFASTLRIDCGGLGDGADWVGDCFFDGGEATLSATVPPQTQRVGAFTYRLPLPMLPGSRVYTVRLHFPAEFAASSGSGSLTLSLNGSAVPLNRDLEAANVANGTSLREFRGVLPNVDGAIELVFSDNAALSGIEVLPEA